jgi:hypothetical protein
MREIRTYGSEGGATGVITGRSYPYLMPRAPDVNLFPDLYLNG